MVRSGGASRCSGGGRSIVFLVQGSQEVANVCSLSATSLRWSRAFLITAALFIPRADPLSLGLVVMQVVELVQGVPDYCSVVMNDTVHLKGRPAQP